MKKKWKNTTDWPNFDGMLEVILQDSGSAPPVSPYSKVEVVLLLAWPPPMVPDVLTCLRVVPPCSSAKKQRNWEVVCGHHQQNDYFIGCLANCLPYLSLFYSIFKAACVIVNQCCFLRGQFNFTEVWLTRSYFVLFECSFYIFEQFIFILSLFNNIVWTFCGKIKNSQICVVLNF